MKNPFGNVPGYGPPQNPLRNGDTVKKLKKKQQEVLHKQLGIRPPKNPLS